MKASERHALREEGAPEAWINDSALMAHLNQCENERLIAEAREEFIAQQQRVSIADLFGESESVYTWEPKPVRQLKPVSKRSLRKANGLQEEITLREKQPRRSYLKETAGNGYIWEGKEDQTKAALLRNSLLEAFEVAVTSVSYRSVWMWIRLWDRTNPFSFEECCCTLNLASDTLRDQLNQRRREALDHAAWVVTEHQFLEMEIIETRATAKLPAEWDHLGELKDQLEDLENQTDIHLTGESTSKSIQRKLVHIQLRLSEHTQSEQDSDRSDWQLDQRELNQMAKELENCRITAGELPQNDLIDQLSQRVAKLIDSLIL